MRSQLRRLVAGGFLAAIASCPPAIGADAEDSVPRANDGAAETSEVLSDEGLVVGPLLLDLGLVLSAGYDDNVFATRNDRAGDNPIIATPSGRLSWEGEQGGAALYGSADVARHRDETDEDWADFTIGTEGDAQLTDGVGLFGGLEYGRDHESRESSTTRRRPEVPRSTTTTATVRRPASGAASATP